MENEIKKLQEMLNTMEPGTLGYILVQTELKEKQAFLDSLSRLI